MGSDGERKIELALVHVRDWVAWAQPSIFVVQGTGVEIGVTFRSPRRVKRRSDGSTSSAGTDNGGDLTKNG